MSWEHTNRPGVMAELITCPVCQRKVKRWRNACKPRTVPEHIDVRTGSQCSLSRQMVCVEDGGSVRKKGGVA